MKYKSDTFSRIQTLSEKDFSLSNRRLQRLISKLEKEAKCGGDTSKISICECKKVCEIYKRYEKMEEFSVAEKYLKT